MGIRIGFNPSASHSGMGEKFAGPGGQGAGMPENVWGSGWSPATTENIGWQGYNPATIAANAPGVNTGNEFTPTGGLNPFNSNPYNIDNITQPTDWYANPTAGWESFAPTTGVNPFNSNPFNIDNITQPSNPFAWSNLGFPSNITRNYFNTPVRNPFAWSNLGMGPEQ